MAGKIQINPLNNANIYIDGNCLLGRAEEVKLPAVKFEMADHKAVGMVGTIKLPSGIEALEGESKWNSFYQDVWGRLLDPVTSVQLQVRGNLETHTSLGRIAQVSYVVYLAASSTKCRWVTSSRTTRPSSPASSTRPIP